jgi:predicted AAA+ superfamily ATPase
MPVMLIIGPRQCGKTTLSKIIGQELGMGYISCDNIPTLASIEFDPVGFLNSQTKPLIIDEAQRAPELFLPIKVDVDNNRYPGRYLLTGSANPLLVPRLGDGLTGRMGICPMWPFSQGEIRGVKETFLEHLLGKGSWNKEYPVLSQHEIVEMLMKGGFPPAIAAKSVDERREWCNDYLFNALQKDINDLSKIEHFSQMPSLLYGIANRIGSPLNVNALTDLIKTSEATIRRYIELLKSLFLIYPLASWSRNIDKKLAKAPKVYFSDTSLLLHSMDFDEQRLLKLPNVLGQVFENFVVMELVKQATWSSEPVKLYHYKTHDQKEVDIVVESPSGKVIGIEVKLSAIVRKEDLKGLMSLKEYVGDDFYKGIVLYTGNNTLPFGDSFTALPMTALWSG